MWSQGIQSCKHLANGQAQMQFTSSYQTTISHEFDDEKQLKNTFSTGSLNDDIASPQDSEMMSHTATFISLLLITLYV